MLIFIKQNKVPDIDIKKNLEVRLERERMSLLLIEGQNGNLKNFWDKKKCLKVHEEAPKSLLYFSCFIYLLELY